MDQRADTELMGVAEAQVALREAQAEYSDATVDATRDAWLRAMGRGDVQAMSREADRLERLERVRRATASTRRMLAGAKLL